MEWSRIKNILIIALLLTNALLLSLIIYSSLDNNEDKNEPVSMEDTLDILEKNGITVSCSSDFDTVSLPALTLSFDSDNGTEYYNTTFAEPAALDEKSAREIADNFIAASEKYNKLRDALVFAASVEAFDENGTPYYIVTYVGEFESIRLSDCYLICNVTDLGVTRVEKRWASAEISAESAPVLPLSQALLSYISGSGDSGDIKNREIVDISLVYSVESHMDNNVTTDTAFPTWKITDSTGAASFVAAYTHD